MGGLEEDAHGAPYRHHQEGHQQEAVNDAGHVLPVVDDLNNKRPEITKVDAWINRVKLLMWRLTQWIFHSIVILINKEVYILSVKKPSFNAKILWYLKINSSIATLSTRIWIGEL